MSFPTEWSGASEVARVRIGNRSCSLCGQQAWDFEGARFVFLLDAREGRDLATAAQRAKQGGTPIDGPRSDYMRVLDWLERHLRPVGKAADTNRLIQLTCNNCGHTELLKERQRQGQ